MEDFCIRILLESPVATPLYSGTLFGQFCWALLMLEGESSLTELLNNFEQKPLVFSDAMPAGFVPVPLLARSPVHVDKDLARRSWLSQEAFLRTRDRLHPDILQQELGKEKDPESALREHRLAHNQINRLTGRTPEEGGLFFVDEWWPQESGTELAIYVRGEMDSQRLCETFAAMGDNGFGKDATTGRGRFRVLDCNPCPELLGVQGNRWVSWSRGVRDARMSDPRYRLYTHYGKLGGSWATSASGPFKYPITLWKPGATFAATDGNPVFGRLLRDVHPKLPQVVHNACHFAVPYQEVQ